MRVSVAGIDLAFIKFQKSCKRLYKALGVVIPVAAAFGADSGVQRAVLASDTAQALGVGLHSPPL